MVTYICKYTPIELLAALGEEAACPNDEIQDFSVSDTMIHSSVCSHAKQLLTALVQDAGREEACSACSPSPRRVIMTNCCDSIRRVCDTLRAQGIPSEGITVLDLPHQAGETAVRRYAGELKKLIREWSGGSGEGEFPRKSSGGSGKGEFSRESSGGSGEREFPRDRFLRAWSEASAAWERFQKSTGPRLVVMGARAGDQLLARLESALSFPVQDLTCGGIRSLPAPPEGAADFSDEELLEAYARALLTQIPCTRMDDTSYRQQLIKEQEAKGLVGIIYHTVRFCDYYSFEYAAIRRQTSLPMLKLESDFTQQSDGQLSTRIAAFREELPSAGKKETLSMNRNASQTPPVHTADKSGGSVPVYIGIDSGSTTTNAVAISQSGEILAYSILRTGAKACDAARRALDEVKGKLAPDCFVAKILATGYGREYISFADETRTEITCHAVGAHFLHPQVRTIIDIGGQDSKVICLDEAGSVVNFIMNDKCAAGTGRFLEMMAHTLEMGLSDMAGRGLAWKKDLVISSVCTVFAESEVVSLIAQNHEIDDIIHALDKAVAAKTCSMVRRAQGTGPYLMTGGVARNTGVRKEIGRELGADIPADEQPDLAGALGAALLAVSGSLPAV